jgi:multiphosphoryl transfer protein
VPILVGLGVDELSVSVPAVPLVKAQIRSLTRGECQQRAREALACATAQQVREGARQPYEQQV